MWWYVGMASKAQRRRKLKRRKAQASKTRPLDAHAHALLGSWEATDAILERVLAADVPLDQIDSEFDDVLAGVLARLAGFDPFALTEAARMAYLPWGSPGSPTFVGLSTPSHVELLALLALSSSAKVNGPTPREPGGVSQFVSRAKSDLDLLLQLAQLRAMARLDPDDQLAAISVRVRASQVWVRNTSYPEVEAATVTDLLDGDAVVRQALLTGLGFGASEALTVLSTCHDLQVEGLNARFTQMTDAFDAHLNFKPMGNDGGDGDATEGADAGEALRGIFEPDHETVSVSIEELAARASLAVSTVRAVVAQFQLDVEESTPSEVVDSFMAGDNPMRVRPLMTTGDGRIMLAHDAHNAGAVRENLEAYLKSTATAWDPYSKHRGELLEDRTSTALSRVLPGARELAGFDYFVPASAQEDADADPNQYTKRVEGDHLVLLDDVAVIVEDKAVALSALARGGKATRLRADLTGIITKAAEQADRLRGCIERDGGVRTRSHGWIDLGHIREIHTIAVSLDDLSCVTTATAELVNAGLLQLTSIPWTVSLHDLELIADLVDRPAEFLLYLRRRRVPEVTLKFSAADELDLFLYFFEEGLWVEPDPDQVRVAFPFLPAPTTAERRRYRSEHPVFVTSRTDKLDQWYAATRGPFVGRVPDVAKPAMVASPLGGLIDTLADRKIEGWLSLGATLLSGATGTQHQMANLPKDLLAVPALRGGRSCTIPIAGETDRAAGWLLVWATRPRGQDVVETERSLRDYLRTKKHQWNIPRGAVFLYDEQSKKLADVYYDGHIGPLSQEQSSRLTDLFPAEKLTTPLPPKAKRPQSKRKKGR